ncbi:cytochrome P450 [Xylariales sp. PMI_506]|nr:cytochrome P450 [Xylariales sp. PMI_506]
MSGTWDEVPITPPVVSPLRVPWLFTGAVGIGLLLVYLTVSWIVGTLRPKGFPPGPPIIPGLGNLHQMPIEKPYLKFHEWAQKYGDVVGLKAGTGNLVLLNTPELVHELFDKRGTVCSNRPINHILTKHVHYEPEEKGIAILQYDEYYRRWRKSFNFILGAAGIKRLLPLLEAEAASLCCKFLDGGKDYEERARHWALAVPLVATTGERLDDMPKDYGEKVCHAQEELLALILPGAAPPVDIFPFLKYVPEILAAWKGRARYARKCIVDDADNYLVGAKKTYSQILDNPDSVGFDSLLPKIMKEQSSSKSGGFTETEMAYIGQAAVGAAVDTTLATFKSLMVAFAAYPETLAKAQKEVDALAGDQPLSGARIHELTYLKACISEVLRWRPTTPQALPHVLTKDERVGEYFFPKDTMFIANAWTIHRNEKEYDRPYDFIPERFLDNPYGLRPEYSAESLENSGRRALYAFGSGRRQCPGEQFAVTSLLLAASKIVWAYDISPPPTGFDVSIETGFKDGTVTQPVHPEVVFTVRSEKKKAGVLADAEHTEQIARQLLG